MAKPPTTDIVRSALTRNSQTTEEVTAVIVAAGYKVSDASIGKALRQLADAGTAVARNRMPKGGKPGATVWALSRATVAALAAKAKAEPKRPAKARPTKATQRPAAAPKAPRVPRAPAAASKPAGADVDAAVAFMETARPVSAQPAPPVKRTRAPRAAGTPHTYIRFARGQLRDAVMAFLQRRDAGAEPCTATDIAKAINAQVPPVATNLDRMVTRGNVELAGQQPRRYRAA